MFDPFFRCPHESLIDQLREASAPHFGWVSLNGFWPLLNATHNLAMFIQHVKEPSVSSKMLNQVYVKSVHFKDCNEILCVGIAVHAVLWMIWKSVDARLRLNDGGDSVQSQLAYHSHLSSWVTGILDMWHASYTITCAAQCALYSAYICGKGHEHEGKIHMNTESLKAWS